MDNARIIKRFTEQDAIKEALVLMNEYPFSERPLLMVKYGEYLAEVVNLEIGMSQIIISKVLKFVFFNSIKEYAIFISEDHLTETHISLESIRELGVLERV